MLVQSFPQLHLTHYSGSKNLSCQFISEDGPFQLWYLTHFVSVFLRIETVVKYQVIMPRNCTPDHLFIPDCLLTCTLSILSSTGGMSAPCNSCSNISSHSEHLCPSVICVPVEKPPMSHLLGYFVPSLLTFRLTWYLTLSLLCLLPKVTLYHLPSWVVSLKQCTL